MKLLHMIVNRGGQWSKGKSFPHFRPSWPTIVTGDEIGDAAAVPMWLDVNGQRMQTGNTNTMIFDCATIIGYLIEFMGLEPGDLILTGTPPGERAGMTLPVFQNVSEIVTLGIDGLGAQRQVITAI